MLIFYQQEGYNMCFRREHFIRNTLSKDTSRVYVWNALRVYLTCDVFQKFNSQSVSLFNTWHVLYQTYDVFHIETHMFQSVTRKHFFFKHVTRFVLNEFQKWNRKSVSISVEKWNVRFYSVQEFKWNTNNSLHR